MSISRGPEDQTQPEKVKFYSNRHFKKMVVETFEKMKQDPFGTVLVFWVIFTGFGLLFNRELSWKWYSIFWLTSAFYMTIEFTKEYKNDIINKKIK